MRILGLDFGSKTVGVAVSDELLITAQGVEIVRRKSPAKLRQTLARIEEIMIIVILNLLEPLKMVIRKEEVNKLKRVVLYLS